MEEINKKRKSNVLERIVLSLESQAELTKRISEVREITNGMLNLSGRAIANFLIEERNSPFTSEELGRLKAKYFDDARAANWVVSEIQSAKKRGEKPDVAALLEKLQMQSVEQKPRSERLPRKREKQSRIPAAINDVQVVNGLTEDNSAV